jgi:hypothetical protein
MMGGRERRGCHFGDKPREMPRAGPTTVEMGHCAPGDMID